MLRKGSKLNSIIRYKCPHCQEGDFFVDNNPYHLGRVGDVRAACAVCGRKFESEPGFYYGAMYVAYGLGVALSIGVYVVLSMVRPDLAIWMQIAAILLCITLLGPLIYTLSKVIWANMFITYKGVPVHGEEEHLSAR